MADDNKSSGFHPFNWLWENFDKLAIIGTIAVAAATGRVSEDADAKSKAAAKAMGASTGGKGDPADEAFFKWAKSKVGNSRDRGQLREILTGLTHHAFQLTHSEKWVRNRGRDAFEEWRVTVCKMGKPTPQDAVDYLTAMAKDIRRHYTRELRQAGVTPFPYDDNNSDHRIARINAYDYAIDQMQSEGTYVPSGTEAAVAIKLKNLAMQMGPKAFNAGKTAYDTTTKKLEAAYQQIKLRAPGYAKQGWGATKTAAVAHADWMEQHAIERKQQDDALGRFDRFLNKILPF